MSYPIGSMYGIYTNIWGILMVNVTIYSSTMDPMGIATHIATKVQEITVPRWPRGVAAALGFGTLLANFVGNHRHQRPVSVEEFLVEISVEILFL